MRATLKATILLVLVTLFRETTAAEDAKTYEGYKVVRIFPQTENEVHFLRFLKEVMSHQLDFWVSPRAPGMAVDVMISPELEGNLLNQLSANGLDNYEIMMENVQDMINQHTPRRDPRDVGTAAFDYSVYHTYQEIQKWITDMEAAYPTIAESIDVATSYEGRTIKAIKIGNKLSSNKRGIWFEGGIHAREWISPATMLFIGKELLENYGSDTEITKLVDQIDWYILPSMNADGYEITWMGDRLWRKTRSDNANSLCIGVDPNRNWDYQWGGNGASSSPCAEDYMGPSAFSEIEVSQVANYVKGIKDLDVFIDFHAYSQLWMSPWGFTRYPTADETAQIDLSAKAVAALRAVHRTRYDYGPIAQTLYPASGSSSDWAYGPRENGGAGILHSYAVELRDKGTYGFLLPENQIIPTGEETFAAVKVVGNEVLA